jgi:hypothetical protein
MVSMTCGKAYTGISIYEVEAEGDRIVPLFYVTEGGVTYDNRSMATGELSACSLAWNLRALPPGSAILIEEPEAYLPPIGHTGIFALIAHAALKQKLCVILTTHSSIIASNVPEKGLLAVKKRSRLSTLPAKRQSKIAVLSALGLRSAVNAVIFVEDNIAAGVLKEVLGIHEFAVACNIEVVAVPDGSGGVKRALENLPEGVSSIHFLGVLDGDQLEVSKKWPSLPKLALLPFEEGIEAELLAIIGDFPRPFAKLVGREERHITDTLEGCRGNDAHDRFQILADALGLEKKALIPLAFRHWLSRPGHRAKVKKLAREVAGKLKIQLPNA